MRFRFSMLLVLAALCCGCSGEPGGEILEFWAMGREGEAVQSLVSEFERSNPGVRVKVQQIPWSAAHEKLLTAYAGGGLPDVFQLGNTWIPEFVALNAVENLDGRLDPAVREDFFGGIFATNEIEGRLYGLPWYVDTRLLFYRKDILARAGFSDPPRTWKAWTEIMARVQALPGGEHYALLLPMNEWQVPAILGLQLGSGLLRDEARFGDFQAGPFRRAFGFYLALFRQGYAPAVAEAQVANLYREFGRGYYAMIISGPWNIGEFQRRLPEELTGSWATAPLPAPDGELVDCRQDSVEAVKPAGIKGRKSQPNQPRGVQGGEGCGLSAYPGLSLAGGASLVLSRSSRDKALAFKLMEFLLAPERQVAFHHLTGDLPARRSAWADPELAGPGPVHAFKTQLERAAPLPKIPEWERIAAKIAHYAEKVVRGELAEDEALKRLDADVDLILEKRRWLMDKERKTSTDGAYSHGKPFP